MVPSGSELEKEKRDAAYFPTSLCTISAMLLTSGKGKDSNATKGRGSRLEGKKSFGGMIY